MIIVGSQPALHQGMSTEYYYCRDVNIMNSTAARIVTIIRILPKIW